MYSPACNNLVRALYSEVLAIFNVKYGYELADLAERILR